MSAVIQAVYEGGVLRPLEQLDLAEHETVRVTVERLSAVSDVTQRRADYFDPLEGLRVSTGIRDLAENLDDYRFGRRP